MELAAGVLTVTFPYSLRRHFTSAGVPKYPHPTRAAAKAAARRLRTGGTPYRAYLCPMCAGWHVGRGRAATTASAIGGAGASTTGDRPTA